MTVTGLGLPLPGVNVYASNAAESYLGLTGMTNAAGKVSFRLPAVDYNFRADYMSSQYFSGHTAVIAHVNNPNEISTGGGNLMLTVEKEPGTPLSGVNCFLFSSSGTYLGNQQVTSGEGQAEFNLADGNYLIRVDYLGYQFWTSDSTVPTVLSDVLSIVHSDVTVTVNAAYGSDISALDGIPVYLFTAAGAYMGVTAGTDPQGKVTFNLPEADYKVGADYLSGQFWSADFNATDVTVDIPHGLTTVHVFETGVDLSDVPVYLFAETGAYLGRQEHTDSYGIVTFFIPQGTYKFRVDHGGNQIWSDVINVIASEETTVEMDLDVLVSDLTTNPNPVRFDGAPPKYEREKIMLATLGSLTGLFPQLVEGQTTVDKLYFYINDHLGTQRIMTDDAGAVVWRADYKPFGEVVVEPGSIAANKFRFAGQYFDEETGLHYNYFRYYDPKTGRYLTPDPIGLEGGINIYAYANLNPINTVDPLGLEPPPYPASPDFLMPSHLPSNLVPAHNPYKSITRMNTEIAHGIYNPATFRNMVTDYGLWDYKRQVGSAWQDFGNYNFGAAGAASGLFSLETLLREAGRNQVRNNRSLPEWGSPQTGPPYGDDPDDQCLIEEGWNDYWFGMYGTPNEPSIFWGVPVQYIGDNISRNR